MLDKILTSLACFFISIECNRYLLESRKSVDQQLRQLQAFRNPLKTEGIYAKALWVHGLMIKSRHSALYGIPLMRLGCGYRCRQQNVEHTHSSGEFE